MQRVGICKESEPRCHKPWKTPRVSSRFGSPGGGGKQGAVFGSNGKSLRSNLGLGVFR